MLIPPIVLVSLVLLVCILLGIESFYMDYMETSFVLFGIALLSAYSLYVLVLAQKILLTLP